MTKGMRKGKDEVVVVVVAVYIGIRPLQRITARRPANAPSTGRFPQPLSNSGSVVDEMAEVGRGWRGGRRTRRKPECYSIMHVRAAALLLA